MSTTNTTKTPARRQIKPAQSVSDFKARIAIIMRERETGKKYSIIGGPRASASVKLAGLLLAAVAFIGCATQQQSPAQAAAELENTRQAQAEFERLSPEQKLARTESVLAACNTLRQSMDRERELRALEQMAKPKSYNVYSTGGGNYMINGY